MARFLGNATGRTLAETIEKATGHLSDKEMPKATVITRGKRFSPRPAAKTPEDEPAAAKAEPTLDDAQD
jgi:hypothetical protein